MMLALLIAQWMRTPARPFVSIRLPLDGITGGLASSRIGGRPAE
jgi:hypothetical protein